MPKTLTTLGAAALALTLALPLHAQDQAAEQTEELSADTVVATVNGTDITLGEMLVVRASLPEQYQQLGDDVLWDGILDQLVQQEVLAQDEKAVETKRVDLSLKTERRTLLAAETVSAVADAAVTDEALQAAYDAQFADAEQGQEYNASHILVESEDEAKAIIEELNGGADFAEVAKEKSTGPSGPNGGELGWFSAGMMVEPFQAAVETMEAGAISETPVQTQFGWHVIKLNETRAKEAPKLDEVRDQLAQQVQQEAVAAYMDEAESGAEITRKASGDVDPSVLSNFQLLED
ncbi:peptidylprolyl isomerase [Alloyangia pacifica]|uniref:Parvulin-like PPIase n=1 Tax=Alloyangia pacifica TaxID=311180 RepID=A0A1I6S6G7_9RHOB|nr:peptidylprolyl isomerase [Alloyangia pacifica]SDG71975.1 peptidyl-prolyl cis-trans isomerase C [Alloyangia pacifica]SFS72589.1 peptidyl-prolyl cis-trans isomerase C [Alloyangia pacifica]